jgi:sugar phosphate isomerase/epimerase
MQDLGLEFISVFGMPPVEYVELAAGLGCGYVTFSLEPSLAFNPHNYSPYSLRTDAGLRRDVKAALAHHGVRISLGEGFVITSDKDVRDVWGPDLAIMSELGVKRINAVTLEPDFARNVDQYGALAELSASHGIETLVEFIPIFTIPDLPTAVRLVRQVGRPDFRLVIDTMHVGRSGATAAELAALDPALVAHIQLCDAPISPVIPDYLTEAMYERQVPGEGELPLADMLAALPRDKVVIGLEVPRRSEAEAGAGPRERLGRCVAAARELLGDVERRAR